MGHVIGFTPIREIICGEGRGVRQGQQHQSKDQG